MKNLKLFSILCVFAAFAIVGCSKKGDTGPAGPAGATGAAGASGSDSVLHSAWITLAMTPQVDNNNDTFYFQQITASGLSSDILNSGVVLSYIAFLPSSGSSDTTVVNLSDATTYTGAYLTQDLSPQLIELYGGADYSGELFRYVLIPSATLTTGFNGTVYTKAQLKAMTYAQVKKTFGITGSKTN
jgi:hypothetical protein